MASNSWCYSAWAFAFGVILGLYFENIMMYLMKKKCWYSVLFLLVSIASCYSLTMPKNSYIGTVVLHNVQGISLILIIVIWANVIDYSRLPLKWFTTYSTELYLYQFISLELLLSVYKATRNVVNISYTIAVVVMTCMLSFCMKQINNRVISVCIK